MGYNPDLHHRKSIRLPDFDYSFVGAYFVTFCTHQREHLFGEIVQGEMKLNDLGKMVQNRLQVSAQMCEEIRLDEFIIMPNHIHFIVWIVGAHAMRPSTGTTIDKYLNPHFMRNTSERIRPEGACIPEGVWHTPLRRPRSLSSFVGLFKSATTSRFRKIKNNDEQNQCLWQRNYYEHVIRSEAELQRIREYIWNNPREWEMDDEYRRHYMKIPETS